MFNGKQLSKFIQRRGSLYEYISANTVMMIQ